MKTFSRFSFFGVFAALLVLSSGLQAKDDWLPITPQDLAMKDNPAIPGSKAMVLYRSVHRDDALGSQHEYVRIKIFNDEGKEYGNVTIEPFDRGFQVQGVQGRTIHPDGTIIPFTGQVFEKVIVKGRNYRLAVKTFSLPDVTAGSIIEYKYVRYWEAMNPATRTYYYFPRSEWILQGELYQKEAHFWFKSNDESVFSYRVEGVHVPAATKFSKDPFSHALTLDVSDIQPFEEEPFMPPPLEARMRVMFFYSTDLRIPEGDEYWKMHGKKWYGQAEGFMDKKNASMKAVASVTAGSDTPEQKLRKLYEYVQGFENLSYERAKDEKELKMLNMRENRTIEDVLNNKFGYRNDLNRTFVALARSAGADATLVKIEERDEGLLHKEWPSFSQLGYEVAMVKMDGKTTFLDPGSPFCPYGILPWADTGVQGLVLDKSMPTWITTPVFDPEQATIKRAANVKLTDDGSLAGEVTVTFVGQSAFNRRLQSRNEDETARKKTMEEVLQEWLPLKGTVELVEVNDWKSSTLPLIAKYKVTLPGYASQAGHRVLIPSTLFAGAYRNPFPGTHRVNPIFMEYKWDEADDVTIALPKSFQIESLPKASADKNAVAEVTTAYANENGTLHFTRDFQFKTIALEEKYYPALRNYFAKVQAGTNEQAVLTMAQ